MVGCGSSGQGRNGQGAACGLARAGAKHEHVSDGARGVRSAGSTSGVKVWLQEVVHGVMTYLVEGCWLVERRQCGTRYHIDSGSHLGYV